VFAINAIDRTGTAQFHGETPNPHENDENIGNAAVAAWASDGRAISKVNYASLTGRAFSN
jgi:hypothetical protein